MTTERPYSTYDPTLRILFETAFESPVVIEFPSEFDAKRERNHLYAFRRAIEFAKEKGLENLKVISKLLSFKIEGSKLTVYRPRYTKLELKALEEVKRQRQKGTTK